ncbi:NADH dehydrogenase subunit 4 (mitochondrion) [Helicoverpa armigera]|uniref:NADH-ubiquinone oxidoreductase chain 4 n=3 Tax=Helicoverpa armigera TaxID=29058 RepID=E3T2E3_HELAM|nr:NADH dehydrogenase subunit 4 [Helicoverpa armigera]AZL93584.1 NADH dehydrogenase subunit 4 [Helicoverpa armigera armigera]AZL93636.1 NADH dehydrogenase subunit 4 [Helicoverpa armigera conferta]ACZ83045.1 NADH dehydrogenase subunit 4 [Helicoverpa armigera]AZL93597.1 NADH dehydrogenase subunit 4 [Helicoverpa armigera armigera]AZL93610.1 NADH dehydrogenase subunit 4 [Helicoverpa armigera armigera]
MMKFLFMLIFMIPMCFMKNMFWMVQMMLFLLMFLFMNLGMSLNLFCNFSYMLSCDIMSYGLIMLSIWISVLMIMASENLYKMNFFLNFFLFNIIFLLIMLYLTFSTMNMFLFYLFFEGSLIPTLMLIIGWGYQPERIQAGMYLLFYTLFVSLPLLMGIFYLYNEMQSMMIYFLKFMNLNIYMLYFSMIMAFLVKMPMYFVHLWLPKAHVEAPVSGSMILAGIMLKLGGYGLLRLMIFLQEINLKLNYIWIVISLIGGFYISLKCFSQIDIKSLIAYSSVAHMSIVISGIMVMNYWGFIGSYILMIGHGLCSSGMFCLANISYERLHSRSLYINKGMMNFMPSMSLWWFLLMSSNMAAPPSLNLMGEISLINSLMSWSWVSMFMLMMISFFSAGYSLYLYSFVQHGKYYSGVYSYYTGVSREYLMLILHWLPLNILIMKIDYSMIWF